MEITKSVGQVLRNYATFTGRAGRPEFWWWYLSIVLVGAVFAAAAWLLGSGVVGDVLRVAYGLYWLAVLVPTLAVGVRRLHDTGRSGWWLLFGLVPILGWLLLVIFALPGAPDRNQYGSRPA